MIYGQCDHTAFAQFGPPTYIAQHFLSWHRAYLFFFEATLKAAAQEAGVNTPFELPYWNWYADGALPAVFTTGNDQTNPLWHARAGTGVTPSNLQRGFFNEHKLLPVSAATYRQSFSTPLEGNPHGSVHGAIGGDMGFVLRSARDPIFWLHHANIDRLWNVWLGMGQGRANPPAGSAWYQQGWRFDAAGTLRKTAQQVAAPDALGYRYDNEAAPPPGAAAVAPQPAPEIMLQGAIVAVPAPPAQAHGGPPAPPAPVSRSPAFQLGDRSLGIDLPLAPAIQQRLRGVLAAAAAGPTPRAVVRVRQLKLTPEAKDGGFSYSLIATLPGATASREVLLAEINTFTLSTASHGDGHEGHAAAAVDGPTDLTFDLESALRTLGARASLGGGVRVVFRPVQAPPEGGGAERRFVDVATVEVGVAP
jgi:tyrosinase